MAQADSAECHVACRGKRRATLRLRRLATPLCRGFALGKVAWPWRVSRSAGLDLSNNKSLGAVVLWWQKPRRTGVVPESTGLIGLGAGALPSGWVCKVSAIVGRYGSW